MKKNLFPIVLLLLGSTLSAQQDFFAITGKISPTIQFNDIRALELSKSKADEVLFSVNTEPKIFSQTRKSAITEDKNAYGNAQSTTLAALALEPNSGNLVYMPMFSSNIYVYNPKTKETILVENDVARVSACDINSHMTRMTTGADGSIYAMNNSGTQFIQISKRNNQYSVKDLGIVKDDSSNGKNSFTAVETGFGGDIIADADHNFYVFSTSGNVFKILTKELKAKYIGKIEGLPEKYSVNGAAVNAKGNIVIASAKGGSLFEVNLKDLVAQKISGENTQPIYDLASKYLINEKLNPSQSLANIDIYPTKVDHQEFTVIVDDKKITGNLTLKMFDISGREVLKQVILPRGGKLNQQIYLKNFIMGSYIVNITEDSGKVVLTKKIIITN